MNLKEENHEIKIELNKFKKKSDILDKEFMEMRRLGEEANKSHFSNNMTLFYHVCICLFLLYFYYCLFLVIVLFILELNS